VSRVGAFGISAVVPEGWDARFFRHADGEPTAHLASFRLPPADGEFGSAATARMRDGAIFLALTEYHESQADRGLFAADVPRSLAAAELGARSLLQPRPGQRGVQRFFSAAGRAFCLYVVVAAVDDRRLASLLDDASACLRTLRIEPRRGQRVGTR
jgi:hypothetical protein